jgi:putative nucleotidyltransferase with HDIG domain
MPGIEETAVTSASQIALGKARSAIASLERSIAMLSIAHHYRDPFTVLHQQRTAELAAAIAGELGLASLDIAVLRLAASVHDIGKIAVPTEILYRPDALSDAEYAVVKTHSSIGQSILQRLESPFAVAQIVSQHHERCDGSGYPRGLQGAQILPEARILAVADVFDAMTSKRPYRDGLPSDFVLGELQAMASRKLDADAVAACRDYVVRRDAAPVTVLPGADSRLNDRALPPNPHHP